jgi:hypothetical protein
MEMTTDMTLETPTRPGNPATSDSTQAGPSHVLGLRCRACGRPEELGPSFVCSACFGPLEIVYDLDVARAVLTRETIAARDPGGHVAGRPDDQLVAGQLGVQRAELAPQRGDDVSHGPPPRGCRAGAGRA